MPHILCSFVPFRFVSFFSRLLRNQPPREPSGAAHSTEHHSRTEEVCIVSSEDSVKPISGDVPQKYPLTEEQLRNKIEEFISSIDEGAVTRLASQYNENKPCTVTRRANGSFNVCFFVHFHADNVAWVVRIPIEPVVHNSWDKVQSEVSTIQYIKQRTSIPVPNVRAFGKDALLREDRSSTQAFMILDYIPGRSLNINTLANAAEHRRKQFHNELLDILAQLRQLEFPTVGSLMPSTDELKPLVCGVQAMAANELQRNTLQQCDLGAFDSSKSFIDYQFHILSETYRLPTDDLSRKQAELELFALESLREMLNHPADLKLANGPFVLAHPDLRCGNILVDDDLHILGIIDWEFAHTVPRQLFTPPPWITGHDLDAVAGLLHNTIYTDFQKVLQEKSLVCGGCAQLMMDWGDQHQLMLPVAQILRQPSTLIRVYYKFIFRKLFTGSRDEVVSRYFTHDQTSLASEVEHRIQESKRYTEFLEEWGLLLT